MSGPLVLAIESATARVGCAIGTADGVLASAHSARGRRHAESLAPQIRFVTEQAGVAIADIEIVAVDIGPGLFTGLRVGITTGRAMAHALGVPMIAVTSLEAIASSAGLTGDFAVAVDARRGEVFSACFSRSTTGACAGEPATVSDPEQLASALAEGGVASVLGDGAREYATVFTAHGIRVGGVETAWPTPDAVLHLATGRIATAAPPASVGPLYLRRPDAVARWEAQG